MRTSRIAPCVGDPRNPRARGFPFVPDRALIPTWIRTLRTSPAIRFVENSPEFLRELPHTRFIHNQGGCCAEVTKTEPVGDSVAPAVKGIGGPKSLRPTGKDHCIAVIENRRFVFTTGYLTDVLRCSQSNRWLPSVRFTNLPNTPVDVQAQAPGHYRQNIKEPPHYVSRPFAPRQILQRFHMTAQPQFRRGQASGPRRIGPNQSEAGDLFARGHKAVRHFQRD